MASCPTRSRVLVTSRIEFLITVSPISLIKDNDDIGTLASIALKNPLM